MWCNTYFVCCHATYFHKKKIKKTEKNIPGQFVCYSQLFVFNYYMHLWDIGYNIEYSFIR